jgi:Glycosyl hydrolases family 43
MRRFQKILGSLLAVGLALGLLSACSHVGAGRAAVASRAVPSDTCYLFAYFYHDREAEGFRLAWSPDGYQFEMLNGGKSCLTPTAGEAKIMRDPCLYRGPEGLWHLVWTTGWTGRTIGYASSKDLIHWSEQQTIPVMMHEPEAQNCWAPEIIWDDARKDYLIFWSTTILGRFPETAMSNKRPERNHRVYATTTTDFVHYTPTKLLYDGGFNVIDANLLRDGDGGWLMFVKNETLSPNREKNIRMIRGATAEGPWGEASPALTGDYWAEGPTAIKVGDEYRVYFDKHQMDAIGMVRSRDLKTWDDVSDRVKLPAHARHGCIVAVPRAMIESLRAAWPEATK